MNLIISHFIKTSVIVLLAILLSLESQGQDMIFVTDSIMDVYMMNGYANKHFRPRGKEDKNNLRQGSWKDYEVTIDFAYISVDGNPKQIFGNFLLYGEGKYVAGKREGTWKFFVLEDKTFKKILQKEVWYENGLKSGNFQYYFPNKAPCIQGKYISNEMDGEVTINYENGKLYGTRLYSNGSRIGKHTYLFPSGAIKFEHHFVNDTLDGLYQAFYPSGALEEVFNYQKNNVHGTYKYYHENGQLWIQKEFSDGLLLNVQCNYDDKGNLRDKGTLIDGNGTVNYYTLEGKIYSIQTFENGVLVKQEEK